MAVVFPFATDEDLAIRACGDFTRLVPRDQERAAGEDGSFAAGAPWVLSSASSDFAAQGVATGNVVLLWGAKDTPAAVRLGLLDTPSLFGVESAGASSLTLRRRGEAVGIGLPPGTAAGLSGVRFRVPTLAPQIAQASEDLARTYGIDARVSGRAPGDLYDAGELRRAAILAVLWPLYLAQSRQPDDDWAKKAWALKAELGEVQGRLALHWGSQGRDQAPTSRFGTRISR